VKFVINILSCFTVKMWKVH